MFLNDVHLRRRLGTKLLPGTIRSPEVIFIEMALDISYFPDVPFFTFFLEGVLFYTTELCIDLDS